MNSRVMALAAFAVVAVLMVAGMAIIPESSAEKDPKEYKYGTTFDADYDDVNAYVKELTGEDLVVLIENALNEFMTEYTILVTQPQALADFALTRDTETNDNIMTVYDRLTGSFKLYLAVAGTGPFPEDGTYYVKDGESEIQFYQRVFNENTQPDSSKNVKIDVEFYLDALAVTDIDLETGEFKKSSISARIAMVEKEMHDIFIDPEEDKDGKVVSLTVSNDMVSVSNDIYLDLEMEMTAKNFKIFSNEATWTTNPEINVHIGRLAVSTDLADSIGKRFLESATEGKESSPLPELVIKLLEHGGRNIDLVSTIESLTSSGIPDMAFLLQFKATSVTGTPGYECTELTDPTGTTGKLTFSKGAYIMNMADLVAFIPDTMLTSDQKLALIVAITFAGWNNIDVQDLSSDDGTIRTNINAIYNSTNDTIKDFETEDYTIPQEYLIIAGVGIALSVIVPIMAVLMRRYL